MITKVINRFIRKILIDKAVVFGFLAQFWSMVSTPLTLFLIATKFSAELQGYYYTFASLLALQVFMELGLGQVIKQFACHEWAFLRYNDKNEITGNPDALSRLASLAKFTFKWFLISGIIGVTGLIIAGLIFFGKSSHEMISWKAPWIALSLLCGFSLLLLPIMSIIEGCNQIAQINFNRFVQGLLKNVFLWAAIYLNFGLWAGVASGFSLFIWTIPYLIIKNRAAIKQIAILPITASISWRKELLPLQWRISITWASSYFCFYLFTPVLFKFSGPVVAGQMGLTLAIIGGLSGLSTVWVQTKIPTFGILVAQKKNKQLDALTLRASIIVFSISIAIAFIFELTDIIIYNLGIPIAARLLPPLPTALLLIPQTLMQAPAILTIYLRAHKKEPLMMLSFFSSVLIGLSTILLGRRCGATGIAAGYLVITLLINIPMAIFIWFRCRSKWYPTALQLGTH